MEQRSAKNVRWHNPKKKGKIGKGDKLIKNQLSRAVGSIFAQIAKHDKYAQVSVKKGIRTHGEKALDALLA